MDNLKQMFSKYSILQVYNNSGKQITGFFEVNEMGFDKKVNEMGFVLINLKL